MGFLVFMDLRYRISFFIIIFSFCVLFLGFLVFIGLRYRSFLPSYGGDMLYIKYKIVVCTDTCIILGFNFMTVIDATDFKF